MPILKKQEEGFFLKRKLPSEGTTGWCGPLGVCGPVGFCGTRGWCGPPGYCGPSGPCGLEGFCGPSGTCGPTGYCGPQGTTGNCGLQGSCGPTGFCGPRGNIGLPGFDQYVKNGVFEDSDSGIGNLANTPAFWSAGQITDVAFDQDTWVLKTGYSYEGQYAISLSTDGSRDNDVYTRYSDALIPVNPAEKYFVSVHLRLMIASLAGSFSLTVVEYDEDKAYVTYTVPINTVSVTSSTTWVKHQKGIGADSSFTFNSATRYIQLKLEALNFSKVLADNVRVTKRMEGIDIVLGDAPDDIYLDGEAGTIDMSSGGIVLDGPNTQICVGSGICLSGIGDGSIHVGSYMTLDGAGLGTLWGGNIYTVASAGCESSGHIHVAGSYIEFNAVSGGCPSYYPRFTATNTTGGHGILYASSDGETTTSFYMGGHRLVFGTSTTDTAYFINGGTNGLDLVNASLEISYGGGVNTLQLSSTGSNTGITFGGDVNLYRDAADSLTIDNRLIIVSGLYMGTSSDAYFYKVATNSIAVECNYFQVNQAGSTYSYGLKIEQGGNIWTIVQGGDNKLFFGYNSSSRVIFDDAGGATTITLQGTNAGITFPNSGVIYETAANDLRLDTNLGIARTQTTYNLEVQGAIWASGNVYANQSDDRLKEHKTKIKNAKEIIRKLGGYSFNWNKLAGDREGKFDYGLIAQEVKAIVPEAVYVGPDDGYYGIITEKLMPFIIEAIKELNDEVELLKKTHNGGAID